MLKLGLETGRAVAKRFAIPYNVVFCRPSVVRARFSPGFMRYLMTGGAGFISSHHVEESDDVVVLDNFSTGRMRCAVEIGMWVMRRARELDRTE